MSHTPACGFTTTERSTSADRFASHDLGDGLALIHRVGIYEPRHDLLVCSKIGSYDISVRPNKRDHFLHIPARQSLKLTVRQARRVDVNSALDAAIWQSDQGTLPAHPDRERCNLAKVDGWPELVPPFVGPSVR